MKINLSTLAKYVPLAMGIGILGIGSLFVPWREVAPYLMSISPLTGLLLLALGVLFYFGRIIRFWLMLRFLGQNTKFDVVTIAYLVAQPVSFLPGGEFYRSVMLKKYGDVAHRNGVPSVFAQSLTESLGLLTISLVGAVFLHRYVAILVGVAVIFLVIMGLIQWRKSHKKSHKYINKLPKVNVSYGKLRTFLEKNKYLLSGRNFLLLYATSFISTFSGIAVVYVIAKEFGAQLDLLQSAIAFCLPVILQLVTFLPGGLGVNEQGSVAILALFGVSLPVAVAITIVVRFITLVLGFILGFMAFAYARIAGYKEYH
jgi:glycosyltransferase 2 family protein